MTDLVSFFAIDWSVAIQIAKPITFEQGRAFYLNPIALFQGDMDAPVKLHIVKSPDGVAPAQNATATDELDTFKRLAPDGLGGTRWALPLEGSTTGLNGVGHITDTLLNAGLWVVQYHALTFSSTLRSGTAFLLNGAIIAQAMQTFVPAGTSTLSSSQFSVSGSGASKTITGAPPSGVTDQHIIAGRVA